MHVVTWNIAAPRGCSPTRRAAIVAHLATITPDVVLLQEVGRHVAEELAHDLDRVGLRAVLADIPEPSTKGYASMIAARGELRPAPASWVDAPWPQLLARATVTLTTGDIEVVSAHVPNGSTHGWRKIPLCQRARGTNRRNLHASAPRRPPRGRRPNRDSAAPATPR